MRKGVLFFTASWVLPGHAIDSATELVIMFGFFMNIQKANFFAPSRKLINLQSAHRWRLDVGRKEQIFSVISERNNDYYGTLDFEKEWVEELGVITFFALEVWSQIFDQGEPRKKLPKKFNLPK